MNSRVVAMVEGAAAAALSILLCSLIVFRMPQGGSVSLAGVVPLWVVALRRGPLTGCCAGAAVGLLNFLQNPQVVHPLQPVVDYGLAFGCLGLVGFWPRRPVGAVVVASLAKYSCHVLSGVLFFSSYALGSGRSTLVYSLVYNLSYTLPDLVVAVVVFTALQRRAPRLLAVPAETGKK